MVVVSIKTKVKWVLAGVVILICLLILVLAVTFNLRGEQWALAADLKYSLTANDADERIAFLKQFGWEVEPEPVEVTEVVIPNTFSDVYQQYNEIQKQQGLDLSKFGGVTCKRWVYRVLNYPEPGESVRATLLVADGRVIGGDISSVALDGFMTGFLGRQTELSGAGVVSSEVVEASPVETAALPESVFPTD